jgi:hypothetical protein
MLTSEYCLPHVFYCYYALAHHHNVAAQFVRTGLLAAGEKGRLRL